MKLESFQVMPSHEGYEATAIFQEQNVHPRDGEPIQSMRLMCTKLCDTLEGTGKWLSQLQAILAGVATQATFVDESDPREAIR